jgi:hypothetical protein
MRIEIVMLAAVLVCAPGIAGPARCGADEKSWSIDLSISAKPSLGCGDLKAVVKAFALLDARDLPNTRSGKAVDQSTAARALLSKLRQGDGAPSKGCVALRQAVATTSDMSVALHAIELVTIIDNPGGTCTKGLRAALGDNPDAKGLLEQAADLCKARKEAHCDTLLKQAQ